MLLNAQSQDHGEEECRELDFHGISKGARPSNRGGGGSQTAASRSPESLQDRKHNQPSSRTQGSTSLFGEGSNTTVARTDTVNVCSGGVPRSGPAGAASGGDSLSKIVRLASRHSRVRLGTSKFSNVPPPSMSSVIKTGTSTRLDPMSSSTALKASGFDASNAVWELLSL